MPAVDPATATPGDVSEHISPSDPDVRKTEPLDPRSKGPFHGFDFWEFRHGIRGDRASEGRDYTRQVVGNPLRPAWNGPDTSPFSQDQEPE